MILAPDTIEAIAKALEKVRREPEHGWFQPIIERLRRLEPGQRLIVERMEKLS